MDESYPNLRDILDFNPHNANDFPSEDIRPLLLKDKYSKVSFSPIAVKSVFAASKFSPILHHFKLNLNVEAMGMKIA